MQIPNINRVPTQLYNKEQATIRCRIGVFKDNVKIYETKFLLFTILYSTNIQNYLKCMPGTGRIYLIFVYRYVMLNVKLALEH